MLTQALDLSPLSFYTPMILFFLSYNISYTFYYILAVSIQHLYVFLEFVYWWEVEEKGIPGQCGVPRTETPLALSQRDGPKTHGCHEYWKVHWPRNLGLTISFHVSLLKNILVCLKSPN